MSNHCTVILALTMIKVRSWIDIAMMMMVVGSIGRHRSQTNTTIYLRNRSANTVSAREDMFGPLGISIAPYVRSSRSLYKWVKPIASWYANLAGYRQMGLRYDDLRTVYSESCTSASTSDRLHTVVEERPDVQRVNALLIV